jgi:hypothetical protein
LSELLVRPGEREEVEVSFVDQDDDTEPAIAADVDWGARGNTKGGGGGGPITVWLPETITGRLPERRISRHSVCSLRTLAFFSQGHHCVGGQLRLSQRHAAQMYFASPPSGSFNLRTPQGGSRLQKVQVHFDFFA